MKKSIAVILALVVILSATFTACKTKDNDKDNGAPETVENLEEAENEVGFETVEVTDEDTGEVVTDKDTGEKVTTEVAVVYEKKGKKTIAYVIDKNGDKMKDKNGKYVTAKTNYKVKDKTTTKKSKKTTTKKSATVKTTKTTKPTKSTTANTGANTTRKELTTNPKDLSVPTTNDKGNTVTFSSADQQIIKSMLEVPYLYKANYESAQGVPINIATHAAIWMAQQEGLTMSNYASGTVVIDLFKYFAQTVVNFKSQCNSKGDCDNITYNSSSDSFTITAFEEKKQDVTITEIQDLGGNNFYKVTGTVKNAGGKTKVVAVVQKNKLDSKLGFSIKALKWS